MRAIIVGALILASGAFVGCRWDQGKQQGTRQSGQPAAQPGAQPGTGGAGQSRTSQDRVIPPGATSTSPGTGDVQRDSGGGGAVAPKPGPSDEQTSRPRKRPGLATAGVLGVASVTRMQPQQEGTQDDTLPHTNPEMQEGIGGSGPLEQGDVDPAPQDEPQFPEDSLVIPPLEALKPFSEGQQGTGGSGTGGMTQQAPTAQRNPVIGQVYARNQDQLVVQDVQRDVYSLTLAPDVCISREGRAISLDQLDAGDTIRARWSLREGRRVATWVDVLRDSQPSPNQGTGGSGMDDGSGAQGEEPRVEPLGNDEFQGHRRRNGSRAPGDVRR